MPARVSIRFDPSGEYTVRAGSFCLQAKAREPALAGRRAGRFSFRKGKSGSARIGQVPGTIDRYVSRAGTCETRFEIFLSHEKRFVAVRMGMKNVGNAPVELESMHPLVARGRDGLRLTGTSFRNWRVVRMSRQKNDVPGNYRPSVADDDYLFASFASEGIPAGMGIPSKGRDITRIPCSIASDPCILVKDDRHTERPGFFVGVLGQHEHLSGVGLTTTGDRKQLKELAVACEFDHVVVDPGETRRTHWVMLCEAEDDWHMLREFSGLIMKELKLKLTRKKKPVFYCSWQFYGNSFCQADLEENLAALKKAPIPMDAMLIDGGWARSRGSWEPNDMWPKGMRAAAKAMEAGGYTPGIWTAPFVVYQEDPIRKKYPDLFARRADGKLRDFALAGRSAYVVDPTSPRAPWFFKKVFGKLRRWGFMFHKMDFLRALICTSDIRFHDRKMNRAQAYVLALKLIREAMGNDAYMLCCGGLMEASLGIADGQRTSSDVHGYWYTPGAHKRTTIWTKMSHLTRIKQNQFRNYQGWFWHNDPDALMVRRRQELFRDVQLSYGLFTDEEAFSCTVNHFLGGGLVCLSDKLNELDEDRRALYRHVIPPVSEPAWPLDLARKGGPTLFRSEIVPRCGRLGEWWLLAVSNWNDRPAQRTISLRDAHLPKGIRRVVVFEFRTQTFLGVFRPSETIRLRIPVHGTRVLRVVPWDGKKPVLLGTDMHVSGGGCEIDSISLGTKTIRGTVDTPWDYPITLTAAFPAKGGPTVRAVVVPPGVKRFRIVAADA